MSVHIVVVLCAIGPSVFSPQYRRVCIILSSKTLKPILQRVAAPVEAEWANNNVDPSTYLILQRVAAPVEAEWANNNVDPSTYLILQRVAAPVEAEWANNNVDPSTYLILQRVAAPVEEEWAYNIHPYT